MKDFTSLTALICFAVVATTVACRSTSPSELTDSQAKDAPTNPDDEPVTPPPPPPPPAPVEPYVQVAASTLESTGLYSDFATRKLAEGVRAYEPRFPLYSDGTAKVRYIKLPAGAVIDPTTKELWRFPVGTKIWKEFKTGERVIETRYMEKREGQWVFGTYAWNEAQTEASSWSGAEIPAAASVPVATTNGATQMVDYAIPAFEDCLTCHKQHGAGTTAATRPDPVLGFQAVQLERPVIEALVAQNALTEPGINWAAHAIFANDDRERQVIGYMHGNCGHCHNPRRPEIVPPMGGEAYALNYNLATITQRDESLFIQLIDRPITNANVLIPGIASPSTIKPGKTKESMLYFRMLGAQPPFAMPKIGVRSKDYGFTNGVLKGWIKDLD